MFGQFRNFGEILFIKGGIVGVDAGHFVGVDHAPVELIDTALAHPDEGRFLRQPMLLRQELVPAVPRLALPAAVGRDISDVETAIEQLDFGLGLVVPIAALPRPRVPRRRLFGDDYDTSTLAVLQGGVDSIACCLLLRGLHRCDCAGGIVHDEVVTVESPVPSGLLTFERDAPLLPWTSSQSRKLPLRIISQDRAAEAFLFCYSYQCR